MAYGFNNDKSKQDLTPEAVGAAAASHTHAAGDIVSGTLTTGRIPSLPASKIGSGTLVLARMGIIVITGTINSVGANTTTSAEASLTSYGITESNYMNYVVLAVEEAYTSAPNEWTYDPTYNRAGIKLTDISVQVRNYSSSAKNIKWRAVLLKIA
jgi:hypothetical protein